MLITLEKDDVRIMEGLFDQMNAWSKLISLRSDKPNPKCFREFSNFMIETFDKVMAEPEEYHNLNKYTIERFKLKYDFIQELKEERDKEFGSGME